VANYTAAILQLIDENPGISSSEINSRLGLEGRKIENMIRPYIEKGHVAVTKTCIQGKREIRKTFRATEKSRDTMGGSVQYGMLNKWTLEEQEILINLYPNHSNSSIAIRLGRTVGQVDGKAAKLKLRKSAGYVSKTTRPTAWSAEQVEILRQRYPEEKAAKIAESIHKSESQVISKAFKLGLRKSDAFWKKASEHLAAFAGHIHTRKVLPIGTEKIHSGYVHIKVQDPGIWELKHQQVWRAHHGEYDTKTHVLWFIDRNPLNCDIANLELITKLEMTNRAALKQYPKELRDVIKLHNKLKRRLREQH